MLSPLTYLSSTYLKFLGRYRLEKLPVSERIFMKIGLLPVLDHFYQPLINPKKYLTKSLSTDRPLPGIDWNVAEQLRYLERFNHMDEARQLPLTNKGLTERDFYYNNSMFCSGDAEYYYGLIRWLKPKKIIEVGSGMSTLLALKAIEANKKENDQHQTQLTCIEPYRNDWLASLNVSFVKKKVEEMSLEFFQDLGEGDILFIDSSHIIRAQGDVLSEYLTILPSLRPGVLVHVHDIFSPKDYPEQWVVKDHRLWNEQYLLEAFLSFNSRFKIIGALNYLCHNHRSELLARCPVLASQSGREPGSFWFKSI